MKTNLQKNIEAKVKGLWTLVSKWHLFWRSSVTFYSYFRAVTSFLWRNIITSAYRTRIQIGKHEFRVALAIAERLRNPRSDDVGVYVIK